MSASKCERDGKVPRFYGEQSDGERKVRGLDTLTKVSAICLKPSCMYHEEFTYSTNTTMFVCTACNHTHARTMKRIRTLDLGSNLAAQLASSA